ncbi:CCR4-NOT transcription complex subunit 2-like isoform X2 [Panonychus citri]|uniref:CCR4-NOT transcription complex subunit 2-like isoform X2 n=1 Tax=Panonychus citri TaxID=50023 RepID=UPI0023083005|nr:CCR4-NOT transcription complex subunit 2-like isoform X2 [Panonychus citri]
MTPPTQQQSPNSFLASLSARLLQNRNMGGQQHYPVPSRSGPLTDLFDAATVHNNNLLANFRAANSSHSNFGIPTVSESGRGPPSALDLSEFPSLSGGSVSGSLFNSNSGAPGSSRPPYVGMVKDNVPTSSSSGEFTILSEDFPALPGSTINVHSNSGGSGGHDNVNSNQNSSSGLQGLLNSSSSVVGNSLSSNSGTSVGREGNSGSGGGVLSGSSGVISSSKNLKRGIQTSKDGRVTNIPAGMVTDQFGMVGLLTFIRAAESDPNLVSLALGIDLATLKLDLNSPENLYSTFCGPWSDQPLKPHEMDYPVPHEYLINSQIREKLLPIKLSRYGDDTLFFLFYMFSNDLIQIAAASELYARDWRYHKDEKVWITRAPGMPPIEKSQNYERGTYYFFDAINWRRVAKEFHLDYDRLENRPVAAPYSHVANLVGQQTTPTGSLVSL